MESFTSSYYGYTTLERELQKNSTTTNKINILHIETSHKNVDSDENNALKRLLTEMDHLCGTMVHHDHTTLCKKRFLHSAVIGTDWAHHAQLKNRSTENLGEPIDISHKEIDYIN